MELSSYPSIFNLGHITAYVIFKDKVLIQEKVDGSQFSFGVRNRVLFARSKNVDQPMDNPAKMFGKGIEVIKYIQATIGLHEGWTYRGEYLDKPKHNVLTYSRVPKDNIIIFDIMTEEQEGYLPYPDVALEASRIGLEVVPTYSLTTITSPEQVKDLLEYDSCLGGTKIEGIVFKQYKLFGSDKKPLMAKYVSEKFKETAKQEWKPRTNEGVINEIADHVCTKARWDKAIQHLREQGLITDAPQDIPTLIKEVKNDVIKEEIEYIKEMLYKVFQKDILSAVTRGLPEWYKEKLLNKQFEK